MHTFYIQFEIYIDCIFAQRKVVHRYSVYISIIHWKFPKFASKRLFNSFWLFGVGEFNERFIVMTVSPVVSESALGRTCTIPLLMHKWTHSNVVLDQWTWFAEYLLLECAHSFIHSADSEIGWHRFESIGYRVGYALIERWISIDDSTLLESSLIQFPTGYPRTVLDWMNR